MARMPIYQETGAPAVTPITPPTVDQAGLRMQTAGYTNLAEASQRVVDFALAEKTRQSEVAGAAEGARNPFGVLDELEGKVLPTAYDRSALDTATRFAVAKISNSTELQILTAISDAQENGLDPADLNARISGIISGAADATGSVSPDAAGALMMDLRSYAAANSLQYQGNYLKLQEAENIDEWKAALQGHQVQIEQLVRQGELSEAELRIEIFTKDAEDLGISDAQITTAVTGFRQSMALANIDALWAGLETVEEQNAFRRQVKADAYNGGGSGLVENLTQSQIRAVLNRFGEEDLRDSRERASDAATLALAEMINTGSVTQETQSLFDAEKVNLTPDELDSVNLKLSYAEEAFNLQSEIPNAVATGNAQALLANLGDRYKDPSLDLEERTLLFDLIEETKIAVATEAAEFNADRTEYRQNLLNGLLSAGDPEIVAAVEAAVQGDTDLWVAAQVAIGLPTAQQTLYPDSVMSAMVETILSGTDLDGNPVDIKKSLVGLEGMSGTNQLRFSNGLRRAGGNQDLGLIVEMVGTPALNDFVSAYVEVGLPGAVDSILQKKVVEAGYTSVENWRKDVNADVAEKFNALFDTYRDAGAGENFIDERTDQFTDAVMTALAADPNAEADDLISALAGHFNDYEFYDGAMLDGDQDTDWWKRALSVSSPFILGVAPVVNAITSPFSDTSFRLHTSDLSKLGQIRESQNSIGTQIANGELRLLVPDLIPQRPDMTIGVAADQDPQDGASQVMSEVPVEDDQFYSALVLRRAYWVNVDDGTLRLFIGEDNRLPVLDASGNFVDIVFGN